MYDGCVLPSVGPLCGIPPWYRLVTFLGEWHRFWNRVEASRLMRGNIPGELDHLGLGFAQAFISRLQAYILSLLSHTTNLKQAFVHQPL